MTTAPDDAGRGATAAAVTSDSAHSGIADAARSDSADSAASRTAARLGVSPLLEVTNLQKHFPIRGGFLRRQVGAVRAVDGVNFTVNKGETLAIVGESGCGKSTTGRAIMRLEQPTGGEVIFHHSELGPVDVTGASKSEMTQIRPKMQIIFQDPFASLDSRMSVGRCIAEPLVINKVLRGKALRDRVAELLRVVGMRPEHASRYPHAFSGGQRQRIGIARAIALNPDLIICDEPVSALDVSVQAQVLNLLEDLQKRLSLTYVFISHDLSVVDHISDRVAVMYVGRVAEVGDREAIFAKPKHPYTEALLSALPEPDPRNQNRPEPLTGDVPSPANPPSGCYFHTRCKYAQERCSEETPELRDVGPGQQAACHFAEDLDLQGTKAGNVIQLPDPGSLRAAVAHSSASIAAAAQQGEQMPDDDSEAGEVDPVEGQVAEHEHDRSEAVRGSDAPGATSRAADEDKASTPGRNSDFPT